MEPLPSERLPSPEVEPEGFRAFWSAYPRKVARKDAMRAYAKALRQDGPDLIGAGLRAWAAHWRDSDTEERFVPHAATWLNRGQYLELPPAQRANEPRGYAGMRAYLRQRGSQ